MQLASPLTIDDFEKLPHELAYYHELVDGELVDVSGNTPNHNGLRDLLIVMLFPYVREHKLGRVLSEQEYQFDRECSWPGCDFLRAGEGKIGRSANCAFSDSFRIWRLRSCRRMIRSRSS